MTDFMWFAFGIIAGAVAMVAPLLGYTRHQDKRIRKLEAKNKALVDLCNEYPTHGFDRNGSHSADTYCCDCGYPHTFDSCGDADLDWYKRLRALLESK